MTGARYARLLQQSCGTHAEQLCRNRSTDTERAKPRRRTVHPETGRWHALATRFSGGAPPPRAERRLRTDGEERGLRGPRSGALSHAYTRRGNPGLLSTGCQQETAACSGLIEGRRRVTRCHL